MSLFNRVATYGSFDLFHVGQLRLLQRAANMGPLMVFISSDKFHEQKRGVGRKVIVPWEQRAEIVSSIHGVNAVFSEDSWSQKERDIANYGIDAIVMGGDWHGHFDHLKDLGVSVIYLPRTDETSTTDIRRKVLELGEDNT